MLLGYALSFGLAWLAVEVRVRATSGPDAQASAGMYAFGDALLFFGVLGIASLVPTGLALFFLRSSRTFWRVWATAALALALTGPFAAGVVQVASGGPQVQGNEILVFLSLMRSFAGPVLLGFDVVSALFAPTRWTRTALLVAVVIEAAVMALTFFHFWGPFGGPFGGHAGGA